jgi:serine/threonine-protein kinase
MRVVIAEDEALLRDGLARLLSDAGVEVVSTVATPDALLRSVEHDRPDVAIVDIRMPPGHTTEGLDAAETIRDEHPTTGVLVLSHYLESRYAMRLLKHHPESVGYLLKDRVSNVAIVLDAIARIADGECVLDPTIVRRLLQQPRQDGPLDELTPREREVLGLMAEGRSNHGIGAALTLSPKTVESHVRQIFMKLELDETPDDHRRVLAVLSYLRS